MDWNRIFTYGSLQPGQLGWRQIQGLVYPVGSESGPLEARLPGHRLCIADGMPVACPVDQDEDPVGGWLVTALPGYAEALQQVVEAFEPRGVYRAAEVDVVFRDGESMRSAVAMIQKGRTPYPPWSEYGPNVTWDMAMDPLFRFGFPALERLGIDAIREIEERGLARLPTESAHFWDAYVKLMGAYLQIWGCLERVLTFTVGVPSDGPRRPDVETDQGIPAVPSAVGKSASQQIKDLDANDSWARPYVEASAVPFLRVFDSRNPSRRFDTDRAPFSTWYQVRSNAVHRSKSSRQDLDVLVKGFTGLRCTLRAMLLGELPTLQYSWRADGS